MNNLNVEENLQESLMNYQITIHDTTEKSPYNLFLKREVKWFLPNFETTQNNNEESREKKLKEAREEKHNKKRHTKHHSLSTVYNPNPMKILNIYRSQIIVETSSGKLFKRNSSFVKKCVGLNESTNTNNNNDYETFGFDDSNKYSNETSNEETPQANPPPGNITRTQESEAEAQPTPEVRRSSRIRQPPSYLRNYILMINILKIKLTKNSLVSFEF